jgi:hypothetical protein
VATEWFERKKSGKKESHAGRILGRLDKDLILSERQAHS